MAFSRKNEFSLKCVQFVTGKALLSYYVGENSAKLFFLHLYALLEVGNGSFKAICNKCQLGSEVVDCFKYIGFGVNHHEKFILLVQKKSCNSISTIPINVKGHFQP